MININITPEMIQLSEMIELRDKMIKLAQDAQTATVRLAREANDLPKLIRLSEQLKLTELYDIFEQQINHNTYERDREKKKLKKKIRKQFKKQVKNHG